MRTKATWDFSPGTLAPLLQLPNLKRLELDAGCIQHLASSVRQPHWMKTSEDLRYQIYEDLINRIIARLPVLPTGIEVVVGAYVFAYTPIPYGMPRGEVEVTITETNIGAATGDQSTTAWSEKSVVEKVS